MTAEQRCAHSFRPIDSSGQLACVYCNAPYRPAFVPASVSLESFQASTNRIDKLESILRQISALEDVPHVDYEMKARLMGALARSMLT